MTIDSTKTVFLIDGSSFLYRAYYSLRPLHSPKGVPVQGVYSFCRMIKKLMETLKPHSIALVWDSPGKTERHETYPAYKATRAAPPSDLFVQKEYIMKFAELIGLAQIAKSGVEADDLMYSIARDLPADDIVLITSDKDMSQMLDERVRIYDTFKEKLITQESFTQEEGFPPTKLPFFYALVGDASDNIPGVAGIGKKGALKLVQQFESLDDLYNNLDKVQEGRALSALEKHKADALLSLDLFLLRYVPLGMKKKDFVWQGQQWAHAAPLFRELNFKSLLKDLETTPSPQSTFLPSAAPLASSLPQVTGNNTFKSILVTTEEELREVCLAIEHTKSFAVDTETTGLRPLEDFCVGISICVAQGIAYYIPFAHCTIEQQLSPAVVIAALKPYLENSVYKKYLHNAKFDQLVLYSLGIQLRGIAFDTLVAARLVATAGQKIGLKNLSLSYLDYEMVSYDDLVKKHKYKNFAQVPLQQAAEYAAADAHQTYMLVPLLEHQLQQAGLQELYTTVDHPLIQVLFAMELRGVLFDIPTNALLAKQVTSNIEEIKESLHGILGDQYVDLNLNSPKQIEQLLFHDLGLMPIKKNTKGPGYSTDQEVLSALAKNHIVPALLLKYREFFKLKSTYIDALPGYVNPKTGAIHTHFSQTIVLTGRLASSDPNLQNIPAEPGLGVAVRQAFAARPGHVFISVDYAQIELRILAHASQDPVLLQAFREGRDIHAQTAAHLFSVSLSEVTQEQRQVGKRINFSILYGMTPYGLSQDMGIPLQQAKQYIEAYFKQFPGVRHWMDSVVEETKKHGYVTTLFGRRRPIPGIYEKNRTLYEEAVRIAVNTRAQGTAADIMRIGMIRLHHAFLQQGVDAHQLLQIHDELLIESSYDAQQWVIQETKKILESIVPWETRLEVSIRVGQNWKEVTK